MTKDLKDKLEYGIFDIVIPTLMMSDIVIFRYTLNELKHSEVVNKIIIIDNTDSRSFRATFSDIIDDKFIIIEDGMNHYVNPAWNIGMSMGTSKYYMLLNDDILCHRSVLSDVKYVLEHKPNVSLLTVSTKVSFNIEQYSKLITENFGPVSTSRVIPNGGRIGWIMAGRRSEWIPIPSGLKIWFGDDFMYRKARTAGRAPEILTSNHISHYTSTTVNKSNLSQLIKDDYAWWEANNRLI